MGGGCWWTDTEDVFVEDTTDPQHNSEHHNPITGHNGPFWTVLRTTLGPVWWLIASQSHRISHPSLIFCIVLLWSNVCTDKSHFQLDSCNECQWWKATVRCGESSCQESFSDCKATQSSFIPTTRTGNHFYAYHIKHKLQCRVKVGECNEAWCPSTGIYCKTDIQLLLESHPH